MMVYILVVTLTKMRHYMKSEKSTICLTAESTNERTIAMRIRFKLSLEPGTRAFARKTLRVHAEVNPWSQAGAVSCMSARGASAPKRIPYIPFMVFSQFLVAAFIDITDITAAHSSTCSSCSTAYIHVVSHPPSLPR